MNKRTPQCFKCSKASYFTFYTSAKTLHHLLLESLVGQLLPNQTLGMKPNSYTSFQQLLYSQLPSCECAVSTDYRKPFFKCSNCHSFFSAYREEVEENECHHPFLQSQLKGPQANRLASVQQQRAENTWSQFYFSLVEK